MSPLKGIPRKMLLEANENLVLAAVKAQTLTEAALTAKDEMSFLAEHDSLTGLPNRSLLLDRATQALAFAQRHHERVALLFLDVDNFKRINDALGHCGGDQVLQAVAARLQGCLRNSDTISRLGGDEFVVLLPSVEALEDAPRLAGLLLQAMAAPHVLDDLEVQVSVSIGISVYPDDARDVATLLRHADTAMYHAKETGKDTCLVFTADMKLPQGRGGAATAGRKRASDGPL